MLGIQQFWALFSSHQQFVRLSLFLSSRSFTRQSSRASAGTPRHNSSPVLVVPRLGSETTCEGRRKLCFATQTAAATSELLAVYAESIQNFTARWQLPLRQSQPETPEVTMRRRSAYHTAAQSYGRSHSEERCYIQIDEQESTADHRRM